MITRQYSLNGDPSDRTSWRISVLREKAGQGGSAAVQDRLRVGDMFDVRGPRNNFGPEESSEYLFIAGGIGITPIQPMINASVAAGARWRLVYGGRSRSSMALIPELIEFGDAVHIHPQDELGLLDLAAILDSPASNTKIYCCGPEALLMAVEERAAVWPKGSLHVERFKAKPVDVASEAADMAFEVVCEQSGVTVSVAPDESIMEALEAAGLSPDNSCREGICGTCETKVLDGIPEHRDSLLSDDERAANDTMMICVGRALCPRLVLDL